MFNRWFLLAGAIAFVIFLPNLIWEIRHHFPHLEMLANIKRNGRDVQMNPIVFLLWDVLMANPLAAPLWIAGLVSLIAGSLKRFRALGLTWIIAYIVLIAGARALLLSAAGVRDDHRRGRGRHRTADRQRRRGSSGRTRRWSFDRRRADRADRRSGPAAETRTSAIAVTHLKQPRFEHRKTTSMPQFFADRFGWPEMVATVARVYNSLPPDGAREDGDLRQ